MAQPVSPAQRIRAEATHHPGEPFLITVTAEGAPHCSQVPVRWTADRPTVPAPRHWHQPTPTGPTRPLSLLYPPATQDGYALIIDGTTDDTGPNLTVTITRAVLHRRGHPTETPCGADCVPLFPE